MHTKKAQENNIALADIWTPTPKITFPAPNGEEYTMMFFNKERVTEVREMLQKLEAHIGLSSSGVATVTQRACIDFIIQWNNRTGIYEVKKVYVDSV